MKIKHLNITIKSREQFLSEAATAFEKAWKTGKITPRHELSFPNTATLRKVITDKRLDLLHAIKKREPDSIYALAKIVKRDLKSVNTDLKVLVDRGLVTLEKHQEERKRTRPRVEFDTLNVMIYL